jgi:hypothetical protein
MNHNDRYCPTIEIPESVKAAHPNCFVLVTNYAGKMAIVDPDMQPRANNIDIGYLIVGNHCYVSRFFRVMGQLVLSGCEVTLQEKNVKIDGTVIWIGLEYELFKTKTLRNAVGSSGRLAN